MKPKLKEKTQDLIDALEEEYGDLEGLEIKLEHPVENGETQKYATLKEVNLYYLHKTNILE